VKTVLISPDGHKDTRRFQLNMSLPRFPQLMDFARRSYAHVIPARAPVSLQYLDDEDDLVNVTSETGMDEAIHFVLARGQNLLKIAVDILQEKVGGGPIEPRAPSRTEPPNGLSARGFSEPERAPPLLDPAGRPSGIMLRVLWDVGFTRREQYDPRLTLRGLLRQEGISPESKVVVNGKDWQLNMDQPIGTLLKNGDTLSCWTSIGRTVARPPDPPEHEDHNHWTSPSVVLCDIKFNYTPRYICLPGILAGRILPFQPERWLLAQPLMHRGHMDGFSQTLDVYYRVVLSHEPTIASFVLSYAAHLQALLNIGTREFPPIIQHPNFRVDLLMRWLNEIRTTGHPFASNDETETDRRQSQIAS
jgi:hypothetical protein